MPLFPMRRVTPRALLLALLFAGACIVLGLAQLQAAQAAPRPICTVETEKARGFVRKNVERRAEDKLRKTLSLIRSERLGRVPGPAFISTVCKTDKALVVCTSAITICGSLQR
ncbi:MAG: hypothetical protein ACPW61_09300 [Methyloligella sp. ZOD6]